MIPFGIRQQLRYGTSLSSQRIFGGFLEHMGRAVYLAITNSIDWQIEGTDAVARAVQAKRKSDQRMYLSFDESNLWYKTFSIEGVTHSQLAHRLTGLPAYCPI